MSKRARNDNEKVLSEVEAEKPPKVELPVQEVKPLERKQSTSQKVEASSTSDKVEMRNQYDKKIN